MSSIIFITVLFTNNVIVFADSNNSEEEIFLEEFYNTTIEDLVNYLKNEKIVKEKELNSIKEEAVSLGTMDNDETKVKTNQKEEEIRFIEKQLTDFEEIPEEKFLNFKKNIANYSSSSLDTETQNQKQITAKGMINPYAQVRAAVLATIKVGKKMGYEMSARLLEHSLSATPNSTYYIYNDDSMISKLKNNSAYKDNLGNLRKKYKNSGNPNNFYAKFKFDYYNSGSIDMAYSIGGLRDGSSVKVNNGTGKLTQVDYYDFPNITFPASMGDALNNLGKLATTTGVCKNYHIRIYTTESFNGYIPNPPNQKSNVTYQVYVGGKWLPNVINLNDYAGIFGKPIQCVYANGSKSKIRYRVHVKGGAWLPWVTQREDYAGVYGKYIDGIQVESLDKTRKARYRVYVGGKWLPWVNDLADYAGIYGKYIEGIQIELVNK